MSYMNSVLILLLAASTLSCARLTDIPKVIWGSSTRALEQARAEALTKTYACSFKQCYEAVLALAFTDDSWSVPVAEYDETAEEEETEQPESTQVKGAGHFAVFIKDPVKKHIVVMGVSGNVDTTEVGIFFNDTAPSTVKLEVASLSSSAKRTVSEIIFHELDQVFSAAE